MARCLQHQIEFDQLKGEHCIQCDRFRTVKELAEHFGLCPKTIRAKFRDVSGEGIFRVQGKRKQSVRVTLTKAERVLRGNA